MNANDLKKCSKTNWVRVEALTDETIDTSDIPSLDDSFFAAARLRMPKGKVPVLLSVDTEVMECFKAQGAEYQNRMNAALRLYVAAHQETQR